MQRANNGLYEFLTGDEDGRLCKDIPESACKHQPRHFLVHVASLSATKMGDGLMDPKLILAWVMSAIGAPAAITGMLVPIRESLALLPQLFISAYIRTMPQRKWAWMAGSVVQGVAVIGMGWAALTLEGTTGGLAILALLTLFAIARSICSTSYKDVLGKTVSKQTRGTATGTAGTIAATGVLLYGLALSAGIIPLTLATISAGLFVGGALWLMAALMFMRLEEEPGATEGGVHGLSVAFEQFGLLREDPQLTRFIIVRSLLMATALAPPFLVTMAGDTGERSLSRLGPFVIAASTASVASAYIWGRFADHSSRQVLIATALAGAVTLLAAGLIGLLQPALLGGFAGPLILFALMIAYQGTRLGRSTHIVDMSPSHKRASYTAVSNTTVGVALLAGGLFGFVADWFGNAVVLLVFAAMCVLAAWVGRGLDEVQRD